MTMNSQIATVADSIAGLTVAGVTLKDIDQIPDSVTRLCPIFFPQPNDFVTGLSFTRQSFGSMGTAKMDCNYTLNYVYLHCEVGEGRSAFAPYAGIITKLELILETILNNDTITGAVDITPATVGNIGVLTSPSGEDYWGLLISLSVTEHTN